MSHLSLPVELTIERACENCGHPADWHRFDDSQDFSVTDPRGRFRCIGYDCEVGGVQPKNPCTCPDYEVSR